MAGNYQKNARIIHEICTENELMQYLANPEFKNDPDHIINVVLTRIAETLHDNPTLAFAHYESEDIYQLCWLWCIDTLKAGKYNYQSSLYGYLEKVCKNKIFKLKRDKQWRSDISDQKACRKCKYRKECNRKISYSDLEKIPKCKVMAAALERNNSKYALSVHADYDITEPVCHRGTHVAVELEDITEFFGENIPEKYKHVFHRFLQGNITGIPKNTVVAARRWCWRILRKLDEEQAEYYKRIYYNSYQRELMRRLRKEAKNNKTKSEKKS